MVGIARWRLVLAGLYVLVLAGAVLFVWRTGMTLRPEPEFGSASEGLDAATDPAVAHASTAPSVDPMAVLRASDDFLEFAGHERAPEARFARLAYENFAPRVDGQRVEWRNKDALWDSLALPIRDELLQLGPEYRQPLWDNNNARPNGVSMAWTDESTGGRGDYAEFVGTYLAESGPRQRYWGYLMRTVNGRGMVVARMTPLEIAESDYANGIDAFERLQEVTWEWIQRQPVLAG